MDPVVRDAPLFSGVGDAAAEALMATMTPVDLTRGEVLFSEGDEGDRLYVVVSGTVKLGRRAPDGRENLLAVLGPSEMLGELSLFDPGPRTATATAVTRVALAGLGPADLERWLDGRPEVARHLLRALARRLRRTNDSVADLVFTDVPGRVAKMLLDLADRFGRPDPGASSASPAVPPVGGVGARYVPHGLTQEELAQLVGASRETVNKALADFTARGWIRLEGRAVVLLDADRLGRRAR